MSRSESKSANYAQIAQRDKLAAALAAETGCSFVEAWTRLLDGELPKGERISEECARMGCEACEEPICRHFCHQSQYEGRVVNGQASCAVIRGLNRRLPQKQVTTLGF